MDLTNNRAPKYVKQNLTELKGDDSVVIGDLHNPLTIIDRAARPKPKKEIRDLSNTINQVHLADNYKEVHSTTAELIFLIQAHMK